MVVAVIGTVIAVIGTVVTIVEAIITVIGTVHAAAIPIAVCLITFI